MSNGVKWFCPDVFGGPVYSPDELGATVDAEEGSVIVVSPPPAKIVQVRVTISSEQVQELEALLHRKAADAAKLLSHYHVASLSDLSPEQFTHAASLLRSRPDVLQEPQIATPDIEQVSTEN